MTVVAAERVVKTYGEGRAARRVLDGASLHVRAGEIVAILGRSGTGKSTLLHLIGGLDRPDAGEISVAGERVTGASERVLSRLRRQRIGFVFQFFHLLPELTGEANVLLAGRVRGAEPDAAMRGQALIDGLGLREVAGSLPHQLSGGEQQRFAIARALVNDPDVLLADEPTGNLDTSAGAEVLRLLRAGAEEGRAVIIVTHEPAAAGIADRVLTLRDGRLISVIADALAALRARRGRTILAALGVLAASLVVGTATTVGYSLATGFDRAAERADLPDIIARFSGEQMREIDPRVSALPNLETRSYRHEALNHALRFGVQETRKGAIITMLGGRRGYAVVEGRDMRDGTTGEVVVERGLAREWGIHVGRHADA